LATPQVITVTYITNVLFYIVFDTNDQYLGYFNFINLCAANALLILEKIATQADPEPVILEK
tara:strand:- start:43 stop:228 length:186 start_codon:yes stop_codon:yes gene_type:complete